MIYQTQYQSKQHKLQEIHFPSLIQIKIWQVICRRTHGVEKICGMSGCCKNTVYPNGTYSQNTEQPQIDFKVSHRIPLDDLLEFESQLYEDKTFAMLHPVGQKIFAIIQQWNNFVGFNAGTYYHARKLEDNQRAFLDQESLKQRGSG